MASDTNIAVLGRLEMRMASFLQHRGDLLRLLDVLSSELELIEDDYTNLNLSQEPPRGEIAHIHRRLLKKRRIHESDIALDHCMQRLKAVREKFCETAILTSELLGREIPNVLEKISEQTRMNSCLLYSLPNELIIKILSYLPVQDIVACCMVSRRMLYICRMVDKMKRLNENFLRGLGSLRSNADRLSQFLDPLCGAHSFVSACVTSLLYRRRFFVR